MVYLCDGRPLRQRRLKPRETATDGQSRRRGALPTTVNEGRDRDLGSSRDNLLPAALYSKEDCGHNDPSMSPGSRSRGAITLTPAPNGAKVFYIACRTRCIAESTVSLTESWWTEKSHVCREGVEHSAKDQKNRRSTPRPMGWYEHM